MFLKGIVNFLKYNPCSIDKIITLNLVNRIAEKIVEGEDLNIMALFYMILNEFSKNGISPKSYLSEKNIELILNKLLNLFDENDELRVFSYK